MVKLLSSVRITVVCLFLLFILTFWGTIAQVQQGLYAAQERFFASFFFLAGGWFPFPGAQLVLWVLFINLLCALFDHFRKHREWTYIGSKISHVGLLLYFAAAFFIFHLSKESYIHLADGEYSNVSRSYNNWEIAYWQASDGKRRVTAVDSGNFRPGTNITFKNLDFTLTVAQYYPNSDAYDSGSSLNPGILSVDGIGLIRPKPMDKEREKNTPGGVFDMVYDGKSHTMLLFGQQPGPVPVRINGKEYEFILRHTSYPLPFTLRLDHFKAEFHPGTDMAKSYESLVTISTGSLTRQVRIYMNNPLRYKDYTIYQASYDKDSSGRQYSMLAVVKNSARVLPYISCLMVFFGLALHFLIQAFVSRSP
jgi:hypothetical protein